MADITGKSPQVAADFPVKAIHAGMNWAYGQYSLTATLSGSDKIQFVKLPDGARVMQVVFSIEGTDINDSKMSIGTSADHDMFIASATIHGNTVYNINVASGVGKVLDISDSATTRYTILQGKLSDGTSFSGSSVGTFRLAVGYTLDQAS